MTSSSAHSLRAALFALSGLAATGAAQAPALPPIHPLGPVEHASTELLGAVSSVRALPNGRLLVNDISGRRIALFDASLALVTVVADTTSATANAYSSRAGGLFAYKGDSSLFVDPTSLSMLVLDGAGKVARVMAVPRPNDAGSLIGGPNGWPGFDAQGRLVYRAPPQFGGIKRDAAGGIAMPEFPDTVALIRLDLASRKVDTVGFLKVQKIKLNMSQDANGRMTMSSITNPMQVVDDWAVLSDGSIALLRGQDYRIDWVLMDGKVASSPKVPFAWHHLDDSAKVAFIDSTRAAMEKLRADAMAKMAAGGGAGGPLLFGPGDAAGGGGGAGPQITIRMGMEAGAAAGRGGEPGPRPAPGAAAAPPALPALNFVPPSELPDYAPPFTTGAARGDLDGNLWVRTSNVVGGGSVYDVINGKGELLDRVQMLPGRVIAGFGKGGVVYTGVRDGAGVRLEQARRTVRAASDR